MQTDRPPRPTTTTSTINAPAAALWASAFVLAALVIVTLGRGNGNIAKADMVSALEDYTILTFDSGNDEGVAILDQRTEDLLIYQVVNRQSLNFVTRAPLPRIFQEGQRIGSGAK